MYLSGFAATCVDQRLCQVLANMAQSKPTTPSGELKKSITKKNTEQMAVITSSCNLDFELQTIVISTIENHKRCKDMSNAHSVLELVAKEKQEKKRPAKILRRLEIGTFSPLTRSAVGNYISKMGSRIDN